MREYWSLEKIAEEFEMENFYGTNLLSYDVSKMNKATWVDFRSNLLGIGGSGIGTILGMNLYKDPLTYFYEIIGLIKGNFKDNPYTFGEPCSRRLSLNHGNIGMAQMNLCGIT